MPLFVELRRHSDTKSQPGGAIVWANRRVTIARGMPDCYDNNTRP